MNFTTEQLLAMAEQCGFGRMIKVENLPPVWHGQNIKMLERFATLAAEAEREACAKIAQDDDHIVDGRTYYDQLGDANATARNIAAAIGARGQE